MFLAEAIQEKDYIEESIINLQYYIEELFTVKDRTEFKMNKNLLDGKLEELKDLYTKYQQYSITVARAKVKATIKVKDTELSLSDTIVIKEVMEDKLRSFESLLGSAKFKNRKEAHILCVDVDELFKEIENIRLDIKTLKSKIDHAVWNIEVV